MKTDVKKQGSNEIHNVATSTTNGPQLESLPCWDSINLRLYADQVPDISLLEEVPSKLTEHENGTYTYKNGEKTWYGKLDNMKIAVSDKSVTIKGSICKWYLGDNLHSMTLADVQNALSQLSEITGLPIEKSYIERVDLAANLIMENPAEAYFPHLGIIEKRNVRPKHMDAGVYYDLPSKPLGKVKLAFYSKEKEAKEHNEPMPSDWKGKNILRYECRFKFYCSSRSAVSLYDKEFYDQCLEQWKEHYDEIVKQNETVLNWGEITSKKDLAKLGLLAACQQVGGVNKAIEQVEQARVMGKLTSKQSFDFRKALIQANEVNGRLTVISPLIEELNKKIDIAYRNGKQLLD